ncbi:MAG: hypothetical protein WC055_00495 [Melioribacteraceae bacterium]
MPIIKRNTKLCVGCGNCEYILGKDIIKRLEINKLELNKEEYDLNKGKILKALDKCYLEALTMEE